MMKNILTLKRMTRFLISMTAVCFVAVCRGDAIWTDRTDKMVISVDSARFPSYTKGATLTVNFDHSFNPTVHYQFSYLSPKDLYIAYSHAYIRLPRVDGWKRKINDDLNLVGFSIEDSEFVRVDMSTYDPFRLNFRPPARSGQFTANIHIKGSITLELARDVIGGGIITPTEIPLMFAYPAIGTPGFWPRPDESSVFLPIFISTSGLIPVSVLCKINIPGGEHIDFGNIVTDSLTPARESENRQTITLDYRCNAAKTLPVDIHLLAGHASFSDAVIASTNPAVGVSLTRNGLPLSPGGKFSTRLQDGQGHDTLTATVTRNPAVAPGAVDTGPFSASAILILEQQ